MYVHVNEATNSVYVTGNDVNLNNWELSRNIWKNISVTADFQSPKAVHSIRADRLIPLVIVDPSSFTRQGHTELISNERLLIGSHA